MRKFQKLTALICAFAILCAQVPSAFAAGEVEYTVDDVFAAARSGNLNTIIDFKENIQAVLEKGGLGKNPKVSFNFVNAQGDTPMMIAARNGHANIVKYLVNEGADVNIVNRSGETALSIANARPEIMQYLNTNPVPTPQPMAVAAVPTSTPTPIPAAAPAPVVSVPQESIAAKEPAAGMSWTTIAATGAVATAIVGAGVVAATNGGTGSSHGGSSGGGSSGNGASNIVPGEEIDCQPGSAPHPDNCNAAALLTAEATAMEGIAMMQANYSLARGYDGRIFNRAVNGTLVDNLPDGFVKVAVLDSGIDLDHPELDGNLLLDQSVTCTNSGCANGGGDKGALIGGSLFYHGTAVAGIIAAERNEDGVGMHGVAPMAKLMSIGFSNSGGNLTFGDVPGIKYALDHGAQVLNASYGSSTPITVEDPTTLHTDLTTTYGGTNYITQFQHIVSNHAIIVFSNGNDALNQPQSFAGLPYYFQGAVAPVGVNQSNYNIVNPTHLDWSKNWVAAISVDANKVISSFSNECGVAAEWCLAAPGEISKSTTNGGGYITNIQGTSFAAPNITGAIAVMLGAYPQLAPEQALQILFDTAEDLGVAGVDTVYGHGLVDLKKATSPADGNWVLAVHGSHSSSSFNVNNSSLNLGSAFGQGLSGHQVHVMFLDRYNKDYDLPLDVFDNKIQYREDNLTKLSKLGYGVFTNTMQIDDNSRVSYSFKDDVGRGRPQLPDYLSNNQDSGDTKLANASYFSKIGDEKQSIDVNFNYETKISDVFTYSALTAANDSNLSITGAYKNPYLGFSSDAKSSIVAYNNKSSRVAMGVYQGTQKQDNSYQFDNSTDSGIKGAFVEYAKKHHKGTVSWVSGVNVENQTFLGSEAAGAFNLAGKTSTYYTGLGSKYYLSDDLALMGSYNIGVTKANASGSSFISEMGNVVSDSFSLGLEYSNFAKDGDKIGVTLTQPLRVRSAKATMNLPYAIDANSNIYYRHQNVNLAAKDQELDLETYYGLRLSEDSQLALSGVYAVNPGNNSANDNEGLLLVKYKKDL